VLLHREDVEADDAVRIDIKLGNSAELGCEKAGAQGFHLALQREPLT
jgi:hypothetical protein